ncbi:MAG: sialate O-acetylesterase [Akkermansiaceae bacterium]
MNKQIVTSFFALSSCLLAIDSDQDGLDDSVETNTGIYVSPSDTGTDPAKADTDGDGAGDWYEVATIDVAPTAPQPNAPNDPNLRTFVPYPLPAPTTPTSSKPVKVYIITGQSNMVGHGNISPQGTAGTLETITKDEYKFPNLLNGTAWAPRSDVTYRGLIAATGNDPLTAGQGNTSSSIGPELGFGHVMGYFHGEPVLIIKSSQGGRALGWDFLPPGSVQYTRGNITYAGFGDSPKSWTTGTTPTPNNFYGGYQFDQCFLDEADWHSGSTFAPVTNVTDVLDNFASQYPQWASQGFEIAGFAWFQGWNDGLSYTAAYAYRYEQNLAQFIRKIREYYVDRYPQNIAEKAPFVVATAAFNGWDETYLNRYPTRRAVLDAQLAVSDPTKYPEFDGNVKTVEARGYWRDVSVSPANQGYHYNRNAETYMLVGDALGRGMIDLLGFSNWIAGFGLDPADQDFLADPDGDGIGNGAEALMGTNPNKANPGLTQVTISGNQLSFQHFTADTLPSDVTGSYEWSLDLDNWYTESDPGIGTTMTITPSDPVAGVTTVTCTTGGNSPGQIFVRMTATKN